MFSPYKINDQITIPADLIEFADEFSRKFKRLTAGLAGTYQSKNAEHTIRYVDYCRDSVTGKKHRTPFRVGHKTGIIEISKKRVMGWTSNQVFHAIIWCFIRYKLVKTDNQSYIDTDIYATKFYCEQGRPKKELLTYYNQMFYSNRTDLNHKRFEAIRKFIFNICETIKHTYNKLLFLLSS